MEKKEIIGFKEKAKERFDKVKNGFLKNSIKLFYNDEDRGKNCFDHLKSIHKEICTDMGEGELIEDSVGLIAGRHVFWDKKTYAEHCILEFQKKCHVDYCIDQQLVEDSVLSASNDEL